jgi:hypothetical protein
MGSRLPDGRSGSATVPLRRLRDGEVVPELRCLGPWGGVPVRIRVGHFEAGFSTLRAEAQLPQPLVRGDGRLHAYQRQDRDRVLPRRSGPAAAEGTPSMTAYVRKPSRGATASDGTGSPSSPLERSFRSRRKWRLRFRICQERATLRRSYRFDWKPAASRRSRRAIRGFRPSLAPASYPRRHGSLRRTASLVVVFASPTRPVRWSWEATRGCDRGLEVGGTPCWLIASLRPTFRSHRPQCRRRVNARAARGNQIREYGHEGDDRSPAPRHGVEGADSVSAPISRPRAP